MTEHLGYEKNSSAGDNSGNSRNGHTEKTEKTELLENKSATINVPRDRNGTFAPVIVPKREKCTPLLNEQIISMYFFGMSDQDIKKAFGKDLQCGRATKSDKPCNKWGIGGSAGMAKSSAGTILCDTAS